MESVNHPKSNIASIFVALLSLGLIFFAVILLNQTFTNRISLASNTSSKPNSLSNKLDISSSAAATNNSSSSSSLIKSSNLKIETTIGDGVGANPNQKSKEESRSIVIMTNPNISSNGNSSASSLTKISQSSSTKSSESSNQVTGEFIAQYIGGNNTEGSKNFQIISCNIKDPIRCKSGTEFYYSDYKNVKEGFEYKFVNPKIEDTPDKFSIEGEKLIER